MARLVASTASNAVSKKHASNTSSSSTSSSSTSSSNSSSSSVKSAGSANSSSSNTVKSTTQGGTTLYKDSKGKTRAANTSLSSGYVSTPGSRAKYSDGTRNENKYTTLSDGVTRVYNPNGYSFYSAADGNYRVSRSGNDTDKWSYLGDSTGGTRTKVYNPNGYDFEKGSDGNYYIKRDNEEDNNISLYSAPSSATLASRDLTTAPSSQTASSYGMSDADSQELVGIQNQYTVLKANGASQGVLDSLHAAAENIRKKYGYSGGTDGSGNISKDYSNYDFGSGFTYKDGKLYATDKNTYDKIQQMKANSNEYANYSDSPYVQKNLAENNQGLASGINANNLYKNANGEWVFGGVNGVNLYDTAYDRTMDSSATQTPEGNFMTKQELYDEYNDSAKLQAQARQNKVDAIINQLNLQKDDTNTNYENAARSAYVSNMMDKMYLPQQMASQGLNGGMTESSLLGLQTAYENNLNSNEIARQQQIRDIENSIINAQLTADSDIANYQAQSNQAALSAYLQQMAAENSYNQWSYSQGIDNERYDDSQKAYYTQLAQATADNYYNREQTEISNKNQADQQAWTNAWNMAGAGIFAPLQALGYDTTNLETQWNLGIRNQELGNELTSAQIANTYATAAKKNLTKSKSGGSSGDDEPYVDPPIDINSINLDDWTWVNGVGRLSSTELKKAVNDGTVDVYKYDDGTYHFKKA